MIAALLVFDAIILYLNPVSGLIVLAAQAYGVARELMKVQR